MNEQPLISVIIPCYNQGHYLAQAIDSALDQLYPSLEVIVVDDGSTDGTPLVAASYPAVRLVRQPNSGLAAARNRGLADCRGTYVVFLDADDRLEPGALRAGASRLDSLPECAFVYGHVRLIDADGSPLST